MFSLLLAVIYIAFISLGLPDSLLGSAWPEMRLVFGEPLSYAGIVSMIISGGTIISSLMSGRVTRRFGTGIVTAVSVAMTAAALLGFSLSGSFYSVCLWAVPYGLGAGGVDAALNNYVALHYGSRHMSWLHCSWGVGASVSPYIMSFFLGTRFGWQGGYRAVSVIQIILTVFLFISLPLWKGKRERTENNGKETTANSGKVTAGRRGAKSVKAKKERELSLAGALRIKGVPYVLIAFFCYCAMETTAGLWAASYFVINRGADTVTAAMFASLFYIGITFGRFLNGFTADRFGDKRMIRTGIVIIAVGVTLTALPTGTPVTAYVGLLVTGLGCAPVYPSIIHSTPSNFGSENSQTIVGIQMASAYCGSTLMPPLFGFIAGHINICLYPFFLAFFAVAMFISTELVNKSVGGKRA